MLRGRNVKVGTAFALLGAAVMACASDSEDAPPERLAPDAPKIGDFEPAPVPTVPRWVQTARIGGTDLWSDMEPHELAAILDERAAQNVSVLEIDTRLSDYLTDDEFDTEVAFLDVAANEAHERDLRAVIYYPSLEVLTENADVSASSMFKDHPDWVQYGIDGTPNVFVGNLEHWVDEGTESAWMSPNSPYRDYFLDRIRKLAGTALDGVWVDVPVYLETGTEWPGAGPYAAQAFREWSGGLELPTEADFNDPTFRKWIRWRHENLAQFVDDIRAAAHEVNPDFMVIIETFPVDNMDGTSTGLDGTYRVSGDNFIRVWEVDSVSNTRAMEYATIEDFTSKIAMYKWAKACERNNPTWSFSYGNQPRDAGLVMAAAVATRNSPFEAKTPEMVQSVGTEFRTRWFGFIKDNEGPLFDLKRTARIGVWYSSATRDYQDFVAGGAYGMYLTIEPPIDDPDWWSTEEGDSPRPKPHLGGWRGAAHALIQMRLPFKVVTDPGNPKSDLRDVSVLWLPSVGAMSDASAAAIRSFVNRGGTVIATGEAPGVFDELGGARPSSVIDDVFGFDGAIGSRVTHFGKGLAIYRPDLRGADAFAMAGDPDEAADAMSGVEQLLRIHVREDVRLDDAPAGVHVEVARESSDRHYLYVVNFSGLQQPLVDAPVDLGLQYLPPQGYRVVSASATSPDAATTTGNLAVHAQSDGYYRIAARVDQFALVRVELAPVAPAPLPAYEGPSFSSASRQEAAESALDFVLNSMRDPRKPAPLNYGVFTNLLDIPPEDQTDLYAHGHHVTAEHMGLILRVAACMKHESAYSESYQFVNEAMVAADYSVVNWAIDSTAQRPLIQMSYDSGAWENANAPLDDLRVVRGLLAGPRQGAIPEASALADRVLRGLYWTSVTDRDRDIYIDFPQYRGGLMGYAWDWAGTDAMQMSPPAESTGLGRLTMGLIPIDYQDLYTIGLAARRDARWQGVLDSATQMLLDAEIASAPGLFWNGLEEGGAYTGDFENRDTNHGKHLKTIQVLWIALHLARVAKLDDLMDAATRNAARAAAQRSLTFFDNYYQANDRVPEYLTFAGGDVPNCVNGAPADCLVPDWENLVNGEARIYALMARLALILDDRTLASQLIEEKILTDRVSNASDPRYGAIGISTASDNDAEAWNVLESALTLCLEAGGE